jgi:hypothetical protein
MAIQGIYKITRKKDGKAYIGQSMDINERMRVHASGATHIEALQSDIRQDGIDGFTFEILQVVHLAEDLSGAEAMHIQQHVAKGIPLYNALLTIEDRVRGVSVALKDSEYAWFDAVASDWGLRSRQQLMNYGLRKFRQLVENGQIDRPNIRRVKGRLVVDESR